MNYLTVMMAITACGVVGLAVYISHLENKNMMEQLDIYCTCSNHRPHCGRRTCRSCGLLNTKSQKHTDELVRQKGQQRKAKMDSFGYYELLREARDRLVASQNELGAELGAFSGEEVECPTCGLLNDRHEIEQQICFVCNHYDELLDV